MKSLMSLVLGLSLAGAAWAHAHAANVPDDMPDAQKIRFCERVRDHALQAFYIRENGRPMKLCE